MIAEKGDGTGAPLRTLGGWKQIRWLRLVLSLGLSALGLWFVTRDASLAEIRRALVTANVPFIFLALAVIGATLLTKAWRWRLLFQPRSEAPPFRHLFWALMLGQFVNTAIPFLRLGEIARVYDLGKQAQSNRSRALGTLVVEKVLDMAVLVLMLFFLLPFVVIPAFVSDSGLVLGAAALLALATLFILAFRTELAVRIVRLGLRPLPDAVEKRLLRVVVTGLEGLSALRSPRASFLLLLSSVVVVLLSVLTPWILFWAMGITLGLLPAAAIHVVVTLGSLPPSTPAKVGVFEFLVAFMLRFFDVGNDSLILTYAIVFHLVVVVPQILLGGIAVARGSNRGRI